jgi:hypothetical protein
MASPYTSQAPVNYNANPPADDGSQVVANQVKWATIKTKLGDPLNTFASAVNAALVAAFAKITGSAGVSSTAISYSVLSSDQGKLIKATASSITITTPDATDVQSPFSFSVLNNSSGSITIDGFSAQTVDGAASISVPAGAGVRLETDGSNWFTEGQNFIGTQVMPQGRLTLTSGTPILNADVSAATAVYYTPYIGNLVPVNNGTLFQMRTFAELTLTLQSNSNYAASAIYDVFVFDSSGTITVGIGPAWSTATAGSGARGTGAGTTELQRVNGIWTNKNSMTARNAGSTYTVPANQGTYVGSISMDGTNGQVSCHVTYGQSRKFGVWNAYNRMPIIMQMGDGTASWSYNSATVRQSNAAAGNTIAAFMGLPEEITQVTFNQRVNGATNNASFGIGVNVTNAFSGFVGDSLTTASAAVSPGPGQHVLQPAIGINNLNACESALDAAGVTYFGTITKMLVTASYRG